MPLWIKFKPVTSSEEYVSFKNRQIKCKNFCLREQKKVLKTVMMYNKKGQTTIVKSRGHKAH